MYTDISVLKLFGNLQFLETQVSFADILEIFDDPDFLEGYDQEHSEKEELYYGIGCLNNILYIIVFYTLRKRIRIISARQADKDEKEEYNDYFKKIKS